MKKIGYLLFCLTLVATLGWTQTVTVNDTQPISATNFHLITDAYAAVTADGATPDVINITGGGPYLETAGIQIKTSVVIEGLGYRPIVVTGPTSGTPNAGTLDNNGIAIYIATGDSNIDVTLRNFVLIPDVSNAPFRGRQFNVPCSVPLSQVVVLKPA